MTIEDVLHALVDQLPGWDSLPEMHAAIDEYFGVPAPAPAPEPEAKPKGKREAA